MFDHLTPFQVHGVDQRGPREACDTYMAIRQTDNRVYGSIWGQNSQKSFSAATEQETALLDM